MTWTPKVCKIMAFVAVIMGSGLVFYILLEFRMKRVGFLGWGSQKRTLHDQPPLCAQNFPRSQGTHIVGSWVIDSISIYRDPRTGTQYIRNWASRV